MRGKLIVLEGTDGSGKATQTAQLLSALAQDGRRVRALSFPCYDSDSSALVRMYLAGEFGQHPQDVNAYAASAFYAVDRYASFKKDWQADYLAGGVFVADRYTTSNAVYQMCKLPEKEWDGYIDWLFDFEYARLGIPQPDLVLYLDVTPEVSRSLLEKRYAGDESKKDIHEKDIAFQNRGRAAAHYCAAVQGWKILRCDEGGAMRPVESIAADIRAAVLEVLGRSC